MWDWVNIDRKATKCLCYLYLIYFQTADHLFEHDLIEKLLKIEQSVGIWISKGHHVVFVWWFVLKMQTIVVKIFIIFTIYERFGIVDVLTASRPSNLVDGSIILREEHNTHALLVQGRWFGLNKLKKYKVHNVELICLFLWNFYSEVEPLSVSLRVYIVLKDQVILSLSNLY